jgi:hypothetical protein
LKKIKFDQAVSLYRDLIKEASDLAFTDSISTIDIDVLDRMINHANEILRFAKNIEDIPTEYLHFDGHNWIHVKNPRN